VTFRASSEFVRRCFAEYGLRTDTSGWYSAIYKPYHLIGLELGISIASIMVRGESTGKTRGFRGGVTAVAKRDLAEGEVLDGEGGYAVYGRLVPAGAPVARPLRSPDRRQPRRAAERPVAAGKLVRWDDCARDDTNPAVRLRQEMEVMCRRDFSLGAFDTQVKNPESGPSSRHSAGPAPLR
jgi:predicted homoserine dehydrogenase-like protein